MSIRNVTSTVSIIPVDGPAAVGPVNCVLIDTDRTVLIDTGIDSEPVYESLKQGMKHAGVDPDHLDMVFLTHPHSDHVGNAKRLRDETGAKIVTSRKAARIVQDFDTHLQREKSFLESYFKDMGMPEQYIDTSLSFIDAKNGADTPIDREITDGEQIQLETGFTMRCMRLYGHAEGSMGYVLPEDGIIMTGDHVLPGITPNPMIQLPDNENPPSSLEQYLASLRSVPVEETSRGIGGHNEVMDDLKARIDEIIEHHDKRSATIKSHVAEAGTITAFDLMEQLFNIEPQEYYLGMAESIGHLRLLESKDLIKRSEGPEGVSFSSES